MKNLKKLFLVTTLLTLSCANFVFGMKKQKQPRKKPAKRSITYAGISIEIPELQRTITPTEYDDSTSNVHLEILNTDEATGTTTNASLPAAATTSQLSFQQTSSKQNPNTTSNVSNDSDEDENDDAQTSPSKHAPTCTTLKFRPQSKSTTTTSSSSSSSSSTTTLNNSNTGVKLPLIKFENPKINHACPLPNELVQLIAQFLPTTKKDVEKQEDVPTLKDIVTLACTCQQFKQLLDPISDPNKPQVINDYSTLLLMRRLPIITKKLQKNHEGFMQNLANKILDLSEIIFQDDEEIKKVLSLFSSIFGQIETLNLSYCNLEKLPTEFIIKFTNLKRLKLNHNHLNEKQLEFLPQLPLLEDLELIGINISMIPEYFKKLIKIKRLILANNILRDHENSIINIALLPELQELNLNECEIALPPAFKDPENFKQLTSLNLSENLLSKEDVTVLAKRTSLKDLKLRDCNVTELPENFAQLQNLEKLDLSSNNLKENAPKIIAKLTKLVELNISYCNSVRITAEFRPVALRILNLSNNFLNENILKIIAQITTLEELDLSNCNISELPEVFTKLINLRKLKLSNNPLNENALKVVAQLPKLEEIGLCKCNITKLPPELIKLKKLDLQGNQLDNDAQEMVAQTTSLNQADRTPQQNR